ncbi:hypothetical protein C8J56DRAFT_962190, partial [Mycena floridula]
DAWKPELLPETAKSEQKKVIGKKLLFIQSSISFNGHIGAKKLLHAGFSADGTVSPLICLEQDKDRYLAETRLIELLDEHHLDDPDLLSVHAKRLWWNICLVLFALLAPFFSISPYVYSIRVFSNPLDLPVLRPVGSLIAVVSIQLILQHRILSIVKSRLIFMSIDQEIKAHNIKLPSKGDKRCFKWDERYTAEECLAGLRTYLETESVGIRAREAEKFGGQYPLVGEERPLGRSHIAIPLGVDQDLLRLREKMHAQFAIHLPPAKWHTGLLVIAQIALAIGIVSSIIGYIGSFDAVRSSSDPGPVIWLSVEVALSLLRIAIWALNPTFDEGTEICLELQLDSNPPLPTCNKYAEYLDEDCILPLVADTSFLAEMSSFTGPLQRFKSRQVSLYYTLVGHSRTKTKVLYVTVRHLTDKMAFFFVRDGTEFRFCHAKIMVDEDSGDLAAKMGPKLDSNHRLARDTVLIESLTRHYTELTAKMYKAHTRDPEVRKLPIHLLWSLQVKPREEGLDVIIPSQMKLTDADCQYLETGLHRRQLNQFLAGRSRWAEMYMRTAQKQMLGVSNKNAPLMSEEWILIEDDLFEQRVELERLLHEEHELYEDIVLAEHRQMLGTQALFHKDVALFHRLVREYNSERKYRVQQSKRRLSERLGKAAEMHEKSTKEVESVAWELWKEDRHPPLTSLEVPLGEPAYSPDAPIHALERRIQEKKSSAPERIKQECESSRLEFDEALMKEMLERDVEDPNFPDDLFQPNHSRYQNTFLSP